jgi:hypothetical protein
LTTVAQVKGLFLKHFEDPWTDQPLKFDEYEVMSDLTVNVHASIRVNPRIRLPKGRFPLQFGQVTGNFSCNLSGLKSLVGSPSRVDGDFNCRHNQLSTLEGAPREIGGDFSFDRNPLTSLEGFPQLVSGTVWLHYPLDMPLLRTLVAKQIEFVGVPPKFRDLTLILQKYAGTGRRGAIQAARELITKGEEMQQLHRLWDNPFEANARW